MFIGGGGPPAVHIWQENGLQPRPDVRDLQLGVFMGGVGARGARED
jgi:hypothetical protein